MPAVSRGAERAAVLLMVLATLLWGATFVAIRDLVRELAPTTLVCGRFAVAAVICWAVLAVRRRPPSRAAWKGGLLSGVILVLSFTLQAAGLRETSAGTSAFLTLAGTLGAAFWAWLLLRQRPSRDLLIGIALALIGSALLSLDHRLAIGHGEAITLLGAIIFPLQIIVAARIAGRVDLIELAAVQSLTMAVLLLPLSGDVPRALLALDPGGLARFAYLAIAGSTIAPLLQLRAQRSLPAGRIALLFALEPVFALAVALWIGDEHFVARWWLGAAIILFAVLGVEWRSAAASPTSRPATS